MFSCLAGPTHYYLLYVFNVYWIQMISRPGGPLCPSDHLLRRKEKLEDSPVTTMCELILIIWPD